MSKNLVIVESPAKAKTISKYLGSDFVVEASVGHVRDLPRSAKGEPVPGVDLENDFRPTYEVTKDAKKVITNLKKLAKKADTVWFATDLDREGEAIAWHLAECLGVEPAQAQRVKFNAIPRPRSQERSGLSTSISIASTPSRPDESWTESSVIGVATSLEEVARPQCGTRAVGCGSDGR